MHVQMQNANDTAACARTEKAYHQKNQGDIHWIEIFGWLSLWTTLEMSEHSRSMLNSMRHMLCGANNTTRSGNLRTTTRNKCQCPGVELTASEVVRVRRILNYVSSPQWPFLMIIRHLTNMSMENPGSISWTRTDHDRGCIFDFLDPAQFCCYQYPFTMFTRFMFNSWSCKKPRETLLWKLNVSDKVPETTNDAQ